MNVSKQTELDKKPKIYNSFTSRVPEASPNGCRIRETFILRLNDRHFKEPFKTGEFDQYDYIQSFANDCDMRVLIARYLNGDPALADRPWPIFSDVNSNTDLRAVLDAHNRLLNAYDTLSYADRSKCSFNEFISLYGDPVNFHAIYKSKLEEANASESGKES